MYIPTLFIGFEECQGEIYGNFIYGSLSNLSNVM